MNGAYDIVISNKKVEYRLRIRRNITIIKGDSGIGKTTLINLIREFSRKGRSSGIKMQCPRECAVIDGDWKLLIQNKRDSILFFDEGNSYIYTKEFAELVEGSSNYFVFITREDLFQLSYSIHEIYKIASFKEFINGHEKTINTFEELYSIQQIRRDSFEPNLVITEDATTGFEFFHGAFKSIECISSKGKSNIVKKIGDHKNRKLFLIVDGAAFGCEMDRVLKSMKQHKNCILFTPESFEWMLIKIGSLSSTKIDINDILANTPKYVFSEVYMSWERYFEDLLVELTSELDYVKKYSKKSRLDTYFLNDKYFKRAFDLLPSFISINNGKLHDASRIY